MNPMLLGEWSTHYEQDLSYLQSKLNIGHAQSVPLLARYKEDQAKRLRIKHPAAILLRESAESDPCCISVLGWGNDD